MDQQIGLVQIYDALKSIQEEHKSLASSVRLIQDRLDRPVPLGQPKENVPSQAHTNHSPRRDQKDMRHSSLSLDSLHDSPRIMAQTSISPWQSPRMGPQRDSADKPGAASDSPSRRTSLSSSSKIILTTYPGQSGIDPLPLSWGEGDPQLRGPVIVTRAPSTIRRRNGKLMITAGFCRRTS